MVWLAIIVAIALGAAGIVTGMDHPPGSPGRADISAAGDAVVNAEARRRRGRPVPLADTVEALGTQARGALAALNGADEKATDAAISQGDQLVAEVIARTTSSAGAGQGPVRGHADGGARRSDAVVARHAALVAALDATDGLDADWARLSAGSVAATKMGGYLAQHDTLIGQAVAKGRLAKYDAAIGLIDQAASQLTAARAERDQLAQTVDVSVLDEWLNRNGDYDVALKNLYTAIKKVSKKVTDATRQAVKAEAAARARLPPDSRGLVIIMAEIGRAGMNEAVIGIEEARGKLTDAIDAATPSPSARPRATRRFLTPARWLHLASKAQPGRSRGTPRSTVHTPEDPIPVQLRVVTDQPWDVPADVLIVPVAARRPPSTVPSASSTGAPAASSRRSSRSGRCAASATPRPWRPAARPRPAGC